MSLANNNPPMTDGARRDVSVFFHRIMFVSALSVVVVLFLPAVMRSLLSDRPDWAITELLINYRGGFVRRGLLGELLLRFCDATGADFFTVVAVLFAAIFATLITAMAALLRPYFDRFPVLAVMLILSPALLMFPVHEWLAYHRKESMMVVLLLVHAIVARRFLSHQMSVRQYTVFTVAGLAPALSVMMLVHEAQMAYLTPHACMSFVAVRQRGVNWRLLGVYLLPCVVAGLMVFHSGNGRMIGPILASVRPHVAIQPGAEGAIGALGWPLSRFMQISHNLMTFPGYAAFYIFAWVLAVLVPALALGQVVRRYAENSAFLSGRWLAAYVVLICACPLPLLIVWADFGRLIHLTAFGVVAFLLSVPIAAPARDAGGPARFWSGPLAAGLALIYIGAWMLPHFEPPRPMIKSGLASSVRRSATLILKHEVDRKRAAPGGPQLSPIAAED